VWVEPTKQRRFGCWLVTIAKRSTRRTGRDRLFAGSATARKALTEPE
jgi:hypothetical protein